MRAQHYVFVRQVRHEIFGIDSAISKKQRLATFRHRLLLRYMLSDALGLLGWSSIGMSIVRKSLTERHTNYGPVDFQQSGCCLVLAPLGVDIDM